MGFPNWGVDHFPNFLGADFNWDAWQLGAAGLSWTLLFLFETRVRLIRLTDGARHDA